MGEKTGIQEIAALLAERQGISQTEAEAFVRTLFEVIEQGLEADKLVKVKGLGTFRLTEVGSRESIDVNTGERIRIESHTKISFIPDTQMRDQINKPFSHFETVILNEGVHFDDMPVETEEETIGEALAEEPVVEASEPIEDPALVLTEEEQPKEAAPEEPAPVIPEEPTPSGRSRSRMPYIVAVAIIVVGFVFLFFIEKRGGGDFPEQEDVAVLVSSQTEPEAPLSKDTSVVAEVLPEPMDTTRTIITGVRKGKDNVIADSTSYVIVGTMAMHQLQRGEILTRISKHYYETKDLWPYIVMHNRDVIKNPNNIPVGTWLRIPALRDK